MKRLCLMILVFGLMVSATDGKIIYVDADGPADFNNIQAAINAANNGDTIIVADGTYRGDGNRDIDFSGKAITVRSIDPNDPNIIATTIIDCSGTETDPHRGFYFHSGEDEHSVLNGFTIMNGDMPGDVGGGIYCYNASPTILNNIITANRAGDGGGIYCYNASPTIIKNTITSNMGYDSGGGIVCSGPSTMPMITNNIIAENRVGGIECYGRSSPSIVNNTIVRNKENCPYGGGSIGSGIYSLGSSPRIINCIFWENACEFKYEIAQDYLGNLTISYSCLEGGQGAVYVWKGTIVWGEGNIDADPLFADPDTSDYHLKSQAGRWDPNKQEWVQDDIISPCIDAGDPMSPIMYEPFPNGGRINMGAYGGTAEASKSYFGKPNCETIVAGDINGDCKVDFKDFAFMAFHWLEDNNPH